jgi:hypothetical protein
MPWPLEIYQLCQMFNCLPFPGGLFDQPAMLLQAIRVCLSVRRTAEKKLKDYDETDHRIKRIIDIMQMRDWDREKYRHKLGLICGAGIFGSDGRLVYEEFERLGLELVIEDVAVKLYGRVHTSN